MSLKDGWNLVKCGFRYRKASKKWEKDMETCKPWDRDKTAAKAKAAGLTTLQGAGSVAGAAAA